MGLETDQWFSGVEGWERKIIIKKYKENFE